MINGSHFSFQIYLNTALHYPRGYTVTITPSGTAQWVFEKGLILVTHSDTLPAGTTIQVNIRPK